MLLFFKEKKNSWQQFCSVWKAISKVKGGLNLINHLKVITDKKQVTELTTTNLSQNSSTENSSSDFQRVKMTTLSQ